MPEGYGHGPRGMAKRAKCTAKKCQVRDYLLSKVKYGFLSVVFAKPRTASADFRKTAFLKQVLSKRGIPSQLDIFSDMLSRVKYEAVINEAFKSTMDA